MKISNAIEVKLRSLKLTHNLTLEEFALLDRNASLNEDGSLPTDDYCIYYRVVCDNHSYGTQSIVDWSGVGPTDLIKQLLKEVEPKIENPKEKNIDRRFEEADDDYVHASNKKQEKYDVWNRHCLD